MQLMIVLVVLWLAEGMYYAELNWGMLVPIAIIALFVPWKVTLSKDASHSGPTDRLQP
jgi:hypothetical protein